MYLLRKFGILARSPTHLDSADEGHTWRQGNAGVSDVCQTEGDCPSAPRPSPRMRAVRVRSHGWRAGERHHVMSGRAAVNDSHKHVSGATPSMAHTLHEHHHPQGGDDAVKAPTEAVRPPTPHTFYTCPMRPEIRQAQPGTCP